MTDKTLRAIGELLEAVQPTGSFAARRTGPAENLALTVDGVGPIRFPVAPDRARQLCAVARPARYGRGEETLLDATVRNTWEVPRERVTIDEQQWHKTLLPVLDTMRVELGLPAGCELSAQLHTMLVYEPGQFFRRHQDSEKADGMIGTLVVTLPSIFTGGELVIEQQGTKVTDQGSLEELSLTAFYGDCEHEVLPVTDGFRVTLVYNLVANGRTGPDPAAFAGHPSVVPLTEQLQAHLTTPVDMSSRFSHTPPAERPPRQLVYLLDHQYSRNGFGWDRLKGRDAARAAIVLAAADNAGYDTSLALAEIEECYEEDYTSWMLIYRQRWERIEDGWRCLESSEVDFDDEGDMIEPIVEDPENLPVRSELPLAPGSEDLGDLFRSTVDLMWLVDRSGAATEPTERRVWDDEFCTGESKPALEPYASEIEGYTGNEGNTASFWYRRAAIVVRPRQ